jgi:hypothetical protein
LKGASTKIAQAVSGTDYSAPGHPHAESDVANLVTDLAAKETPSGAQTKVDTHDGLISPHASATNLEKTANKGAASGYPSLDAGVLVPASQLGSGTPTGAKFLRDDQSWQVPQADFDISYFRHYGTTKYEAWHTSPKVGAALAGSALTINRLYAMPFPCPKGMTLDRIGVYVSTLGTSAHGRLGVYADLGIGASFVYPGSLVLDAGVYDASTTGAKALTISQALPGDILYWLVLVCDVIHSIYCIPVAGVINMLGHSSALGTAQNAGLYVSQTYGALPSTFPSSPTMIVAAPIPAIFVRLSA